MCAFVNPKCSSPGFLDVFFISVTFPVHPLSRSPPQPLLSSWTWAFYMLFSGGLRYSSLGPKDLVCDVTISLIHCYTVIFRSLPVRCGRLSLSLCPRHQQHGRMCLDECGMKAFVNRCSSASFRQKFPHACWLCGTLILTFTS